MGENLSNLREFSKCLDPESIGYSIGQCDFIREIHNSFAKPEPIVYTQGKKRKEKEDVFHFVSFIHLGGKLYEIDGLRRGPILHRENIQNYDDWLSNCVQVIGEWIQSYSEKEIRFHLLAVHKSALK